MLKDKAHENLAAGDLLLERGHVNAATSRYYYSVYQAAVHWLTRQGFRPGKVRSGAVDWDHSMVLNHSRMIRDSWRDRVLFVEMRSLRGQADYGESAVPRLRIEDLQDAVREFVREVAR